MADKSDKPLPSETGVNAPPPVKPGPTAKHGSANAEPVAKLDLPSDDAIEKMSPGEVISHLERLGIPTDRSASPDGLRAALRRAPETIAERESVMAAEQGVKPGHVEGLTPDIT